MYNQGEMGIDEEKRDEGSGKEKRGSEERT